MAHAFLPDMPGLEAPPAPLDTPAELHPGFFMPRLTDTPQNPIMDTIKLRTRKLVTVPYPLPREVEASAEDVWAVAEAHQLVPDDVWQQIAYEEDGKYHRIMSWDTLRNSYQSQKILSPFLSQQCPRVFASVRHCVRLSLHNPSIPLVYISSSKLLRTLHLTLTGVSSSVYVWVAELEQFVLRALPSGTNGTMVLIGIDEVISESIIQRFLTIGTLMRRLENLVHSHRTNRGRTSQVPHSFIHALSSVVDYLRKRLADFTCVEADVEDGPILTAVWMRYAPIEEVLEALAILCNREIHESPRTYSPLPATAVDLLSRIYRQLEEAVDSHSPHAVTAILAYILTVTSKDYFCQLGESVGYNVSVAPSTSVAIHDNDHFGLAIHDEEPVDDQDDTFYEEQVTQKSCPIFIETALAIALRRSKRSLKLLREAQPDHALLHRQRNRTNSSDIQWIWTEAEVAAAWTGHERLQQQAQPIGSHHDQSCGGDLPVRLQVYQEELKEFALFDLTPGHLPAQRASQLDLTAVVDIPLFLHNFPTSLPCLTPTLSHLTALVLSPLTRHMEALSEALVSLMLSPAHLNLSMHLSILRSYLLLTSHTFKSGLAAALFSDSDDLPDTASKLSAEGRRNADLSKSLAAGCWAVGLSPSLTAANIWPPSIPELSFHLRTVVIDSLQGSSGCSLEQEPVPSKQESILREAEYRLGFAIRDLPTSTGKEKWLDPLSIEALDFLYLDYKPPRPLHIVITQDVLSKYHRIFAFNLRLMRATNAIAATYRITRRSKTPLFPTLSSTNKLLAHARFVTNAFVTALSSYIYDRAIGLKFDDFLTKLNVPEHLARSKPPHGFSDVFALAEYHSAVLDDILSACLLRSGQKAVGDLLRGCLELVLELAIIAGDLYRGRLEEYQAALLLENVWESFRKKMLTLITVLRALVERGSGMSREAVADPEAQLASLSRLDGVTGSLHDLVTRLDVSEWWIRR